MPSKGPQGKWDQVRGCLKLNVDDAGFKLLIPFLRIYQKNNANFLFEKREKGIEPICGSTTPAAAVQFEFVCDLTERKACGG